MSRKRARLDGVDGTIDMDTGVFTPGDTPSPTVAATPQPADDWDTPPEMMTPRTAPGIRGNAVQPMRAPVSRGEAVARGGAQGITLGWGDEASAGLGALMETIVPIEGVSDRDASVADRYRRLRDTLRSENEQARADQPGAYFGGELAGGLVAAAPVAMATGGASIPTMMGVGAAEGALSGAGHSASDTQDMSWDALQGGLTGAALPVVGGAMSRAAEPLADASRSLMRKSYQQAAAGAGLDKAAARKMVARSPAQNVGDAFETYGQDLERLGITQGTGRLGLPPRFGEQAERAGAVAQRRGADMGTIANQMTQAGVSVPVDYMVAQSALRKMRPFLRSAQPELRRAAQDLSLAVEQAGEGGMVQMPFNSAWLVRQNINKFRKPLSDSATNAEFDTVSSGLEEAMRAAMERADPGARQAWTSAARDYAITKPLQEAGESREVGEQINQVMSLRNLPGMGAGSAIGGTAGAMLAGPAGATLGSTLGGAAGFGLTQAGRGRGHQASSMAYRALGESLMPAGPAAARLGRQTAFAGTLVAPLAGTQPPSVRIRERFQSNPQAFGQYAPQIQEALQSGDDVDLGALHFRLMATDPAYRAMYERSEQQ